jgi:hypothetical protein
MPRRMKIGEKILIDTGQGRDGKWYWRLRENPTDIHGPFASEREADRDAEVVVLGPNCKITRGGRWDPAWDRKQ